MQAYGQEAEQGEEHECNECGYMESQCQCEDEVAEEFANSATEPKSGVQVYSAAGGVGDIAYAGEPARAKTRYTPANSGDNPLVNENMLGDLGASLMREWQETKLQGVSDEFDAKVAMKAIAEGKTEYRHGSKQCAIRTDNNIIKVFPILENHTLLTMPLLALEASSIVNTQTEGNFTEGSRIAEGTMAHGIFASNAREAQDAMTQLAELLQNPLSAAEAQDLIGDLVYDDQLFDAISDAEDQDPDMDLRQDSKFMGRLEELKSWAQKELEGMSEGSFNDDGSYNTSDDEANEFDEKQPTEGVTEDYGSVEAVAGAITNRIMRQHVDLLSKYGPVKVMAAIDDVAEYAGMDELDEIGSSDVSGWVKQVVNGLESGHFNNVDEGVAEGLNEFAPSPGFGGDDDDDKYTPQNFGKPFNANYLGKNKFEVFCQPPGNRDPSKVIKLTAEVQKYGLEWEDDFGFWFLDSPGAVYLSWKYGEIPLPKAIDQARNPGHIHDLVTDYLTDSPHAAEIQKIATEYFGFTPDGGMNEGVAEGVNVSPEVAQVLAQCGSGELDCYDVMNSPKTPAQQQASKIIQQMYDDVSIDHHLHPDDSFEEIFNIIADQLEQDYGTNEGAHTSTIGAMADSAYQPKVGDKIRTRKGGQIPGTVEKVGDQDGIDYCWFRHPEGKMYKTPCSNVMREDMDEGFMDTVKKGVKAVDKFVTGGDDEDLIKDLQGKMGEPQTGKKPEPKKENIEMNEELAKIMALAGMHEAKVDEQDVDENAYNQAAAAASRSGAKEFEFPKGSGKMHPAKMDKDTAYQIGEASKPDFLDLDDDGNKKEKMSDASKDAKNMDEAKECEDCGKVKCTCDHMDEDFTDMLALAGLSEKKDPEDEEAKMDKGSHQADTTMKHIKNPTQGEKDAVKDIKSGVAGYRDRIDMLKSAEKDGRLKSESTIAEDEELAYVKHLLNKWL
jgi:hypothetical protein